MNKNFLQLCFFDFLHILTCQPAICMRLTVNTLKSPPQTLENYRRMLLLNGTIEKKSKQQLM